MIGRSAVALLSVLMAGAMLLLIKAVIPAAETLPGAVAFPAQAFLGLAALSFAVASLQRVIECFDPRLPADTGGGPLRFAWRTWRLLGDRALLRQTDILLGVIYIVVCGPTWLALRLAGKQLLAQDAPDARTYWLPRERSEPRSFRRQF